MKEGEVFNKQIKLIYDQLTAIKNTIEAKEAGRSTASRTEPSMRFERG